METIRFDLTAPVGDFKRMNAVNNGPVHKRHAADQALGNLPAYRAARIPFARNHDASYCAAYGAEHTVDVSAIFPCFDADENDPASYDFACTDEYILVTQEAGTETFYRLGQRIEHTIRKYNIHPPRDFAKWARICEHIIRHYNEGWADGYRLGLSYWEIWNEPDMTEDDAPYAAKTTWGGTKAQFFDFYETAAKHLKACFPHLHIGGPALCGRLDWAEDFLRMARDRQVPLDFFSHHLYCTDPKVFAERIRAVRALLDRYGFEKTESILNEWNYVRDFEGQWAYSLKKMIGAKGASFTLACMAEGQKNPVDMLMYYDARANSGMNCIFEPSTYGVRKGYYALYWFGMMYDRREVRAKEEPEHIWTLCGVDGAGKSLTMLTHYDENDDAAPRTVHLDFGRKGFYEVTLLGHGADTATFYMTDDPTLTLPVHTIALVREV